MGTLGAMLTRELMPGVALRLLEERDVDELYALVDANRAYLAEWMPWAAGDTREDTAAFIRLSRVQVGENNGLNTAITVADRVAGMAGVGKIDWRNRSTELGYWLAAEHQGRAVAERLGLTLEGIEREAEWIGERPHDLAIYSMLASEWTNGMARTAG